MKTTLLVTGGAGFIGSNLVRILLAETNYRIVVLDALTYAGFMQNLDGLIDGEQCVFVYGSINDSLLVEKIIQEFSIEGIINVAAETHVDRSISGALAFVETNINGTVTLLEAAKKFGVTRFLQVSTDEVYGALDLVADPFTEHHPLQPSSPYSSSKAAADLLVQSYFTTYGLNTIITRCTNNYGPQQFTEKFIPLVTTCALQDKPLPVYGDGLYVRDWIHVNDHCTGILAAYEKGKAGNVYNFGANTERSNISIVTEILLQTGKPTSLIQYVADRPGHDRRYAINAQKAREELGWQPKQDFSLGLADTINWYKQNKDHFVR